MGKKEAVGSAGVEAKGLTGLEVGGEVSGEVNGDVPGEVSAISGTPLAAAAVCKADLHRTIKDELSL